MNCCVQAMISGNIVFYEKHFLMQIYNLNIDYYTKINWVSKKSSFRNVFDVLRS